MHLFRGVGICAPFCFMNRKLILTACLFFATSINWAEDVYLEPSEFVNQAFGGAPPEVETLWVKKEIKENIKKIMDHGYGALRIRYWFKSGRSVWILEEIGKEQPITTGLIVGPQGLESIRVLIYRESRGWEVKHTFFTDQFIGANIDQKLKLNRRIDGITGATLSVRALTKLARLALYFHGIVEQKNT